MAIIVVIIVHAEIIRSKILNLSFLSQPRCHHNIYCAVLQRKKPLLYGSGFFAERFYSPFAFPFLLLTISLCREPAGLVSLEILS